MLRFCSKTVSGSEFRAMSVLAVRDRSCSSCRNAIAILERADRLHITQRLALFHRAQLFVLSTLFDLCEGRGPKTELDYQPKCHCVQCALWH